MKLKICGNGTWKMVQRGRKPKQKPLCMSTISRRLSVFSISSGAAMRERHRQLVADHLRRAAQSAQQRVLVVRSPAGERDAVNAHRGERQDEQHADVQIGQLHAGLRRRRS